MTLVLDTSVVYALVDEEDAAHQRCASLMDDSVGPFVIPTPTLCELDHLFDTRSQQTATQRLLGDIRAGAFVLQDLVPQDYERVMRILDRYEDLDVGFVDASVLAVVERLDEPKLATLDRRHFSTMRPRHVDSLELLPA